MVSVVIHCNPHLANQTESAHWMALGFGAHGIEAEITDDKTRGADMVVIQGPWWAYREWLGKPNVLYLNRCFWGHYRYDVAIGWLNPDGSCDFRNDGMDEANGPLPQLKPEKLGRRSAVVFGDYGRDPIDAVIDAKYKYDAVYFRPHPAQDRNTPVLTLRGDLDAIWALADVAIGHSSTVLVQAAFNGLHVECSDPRHVVHRHGKSREAWLRDLSWANWNYRDIISGAFWEHLA